MFFGLLNEIDGYDRCNGTIVQYMLTTENSNQIFRKDAIECYFQKTILSNGNIDGESVIANS